MEIRIQSINFDAAEKLKAHVEKHMGKLTRIADDIRLAEVYMKVVKPEAAMNKNAEIRLFVQNSELFAEKTADSFEEAIDSCIEALEKQLKKVKEKK